MGVVIYVDGESHFIRTQAAWRKVHGPTASLADVGSSSTGVGSVAYPDPNRPFIRCEPIAKFFWDTNYTFLAPRPFSAPHVSTAVYFTSFAGDDVNYHNACVSIRRHGFDPRVTRERSQLESQRANRLAQSGVLEKAKGVDIGLAVRILEDAYHNNFETCFLFTSDIDFMPVARIVQRMGKKVIVFGYSDGLSTRSEFEYAPDGFVDLGPYVQEKYLPKSDST